MESSPVIYVPDSFARLKSEPSNSVDVILSDPPYPEHVHKNLCSGSLVKGPKAIKGGVPKYELPFAPLIEHEWLHDCLRVARRWVVLFCALEDFGQFKQTVGQKQYARSCIWIKPNAMGQLTKDRPASAYEGIAAMHRADSKKKWNGKGSYGWWICNGTRGKKDRHPNEKPMDLLLKLTALFSERGETVLDPFAGSGAVGQACIELGRQYQGWDNDADWVIKANARVQSSSLKYDTDDHALSLCRFRPASAA